MCGCILRYVIVCTFFGNVILAVIPFYSRIRHRADAGVDVVGQTDAKRTGRQLVTTPSFQK